MKIITSFWFTNPTTQGHGGDPPYGTVGIVVGEDQVTGERKAYVGTAMAINQTVDEKNIAEYGTKLKVERVEELLQLLKPKSINKV